ncbi:MAG: GntR family transcriptional regulator [Candidatus Dormibacteraeota bacterium]|nr:GntR family transcriptional regulator [Candidatus Dormibacteraeota bacterium]
MDLDRSGPVPLYFQVASRIEAAIRSNALPPGSRLEGEISLGERLGLSRPTMRRAIQELVDKGLLVRRRGIGTQVVPWPLSRKVELTSLYEDLAGEGRRPSTTVLLREVVVPDREVCERLGILPPMRSLHVRRLRFSAGAPLAVMENYLAPPFTELSREELAAHGLYQLLRARGTSISVAHQQIGAREASAEESRLLEIRKRAPVLTMERVAYNASGEAVEYGRHCYRPDLYRFETTLVEK